MIHKLSKSHRRRLATNPIYSLRFDGGLDEDGVNCGSAADIDGLPNGGAFTAEVWFICYAAQVGAAYQYLISKGTAFHEGWSLVLSGTGSIKATIMHDDDYDVQAAGTFLDDQPHHIALTWNGTLVQVWYNGILLGQNTPTGDYGGDGSETLTLANDQERNLNGALYFVRVSDIVRYTDTFTPPSYTSPPDVDANTLRQFNFQEGSGTTLIDAAGNANGTIINGVWQSE
jgi:hypothetical protein